MVVIKKGEFGAKPDSQLEISAKSSESILSSAFSDCDNRGMLKLNQEVVINKGDLNDFYRIDKGAPFATGLYAQVKRCKSLRGENANSYYAAKFSPRKRPGQAKDEECVENLHEIALLSQLKNPYIIAFSDAFIMTDCVVTIMELAPGGDLQSVIDADLVLLEKDASRFIFQLLEALKYLHQRHIAHLDIKPQNLLLMGEFPTCDIKLCDFEISRIIMPGKEVKEILGTPDYVAPEILLYEPLSTAADMWSVGILAYVLLTGFSPFGGDTDQETFRNIVHEPIDFPDELFEDVGSSAIDFILKLAVKKAKLRPTPIEMEEHEWIKSFLPPVIPPIVSPVESEPEIIHTNLSINHTGPKKRSPRKTMALSGSSTASAAGRRPSARSILRACKSAYDLNKMDGKTKSREALIEKMKMASGDSSVGGGNWKLRKNLSKSREQLWESKIQLSKSCEKINNNLPGSARWASVANFPSLTSTDLGTLKSSTSQESVISVVSTCTNIGTTSQQELVDCWQKQSLDDYMGPTPQPYSISMPNTPPIPNFHLSSPVNNLRMIQEATSTPNINYSNCVSHPDFNYPSLVNETNTHEINPSDTSSATGQPISSVEAESQKSVAELIMTFGGRVSANAKKLDLKNQFEPILENFLEEVSFGDSDNNSTSGVSSIIATAHKDDFSMNSSSSTEPHYETTKIKCDIDGQLNVAGSRRHSRTSQQIRDDIRSKSTRSTMGNDTPTITRRGSISPPKQHETGLKGILKKPSFPNQSVGTLGNQQKNDHQINNSLLNHGTCLTVPNSAPSSRRGSIPGNCTRLYDTHTISSLAKVPKRSILKSAQATDGKSNRSQSFDSTTPSVKKSSERSSSKSPENSSPTLSPSESEVTIINVIPPPSSSSPTEVPCDSSVNLPQIKSDANKTKIIPKGLSPRESPSFILLNDVKDKKRPTYSSPMKKSAPSKTTQNNATNTSISKIRSKSQGSQNSPTPAKTPNKVSSPRKPIIPITARKIKQQERPIIIYEGKKSSTTTSLITHTISNRKISPPASPNGENPNKSMISCKNSKFKTEINIEPAAVAIKIFPPDPVITKNQCTTPKLEKLSDNVVVVDNDSNNNNNNNYNNTEVHQKDSLVLKNNTINTSVERSPEIRRKSKREKEKDKMSKLDKSTWGIVCGGSIGRALERFETGTIKGKKLRRGSVPDF